MPILRTTGGCCGSVTEQLKAHLGRLGASTVREHRRCGLLQWVSTVDGRRNFAFIKIAIALAWEQCMMMETEDKSGGMNQREVAEALGVSRSLVQQLERQAIKKILKVLAKRKIKREDFF